MKDYAFIQENNHSNKIFALLLSIVILLLILFTGIFFSTILYQSINSIPYIGGFVDFLKENVKNITIAGLFLAHFIGGIFFVPSPDEIIFYYALLKGNSYFFSFIASLSGYMLAQLVNYYAGNKISPLIMHIISKKKVYKTRRYINKYGSAGIFLFNFLPFPAPLLTFALGIAKYNFTRLFVITFAGKVCKYTAIILIYTIFSA